METEAVDDAHGDDEPGDDAIPDTASRSVRAERHRARERERRRRGALFACVIVVLGVYLHCAWSYQKTLDPAPDRRDFHNLIADAFLAGQTNLTIPVPKSLSRLKDPYDPAQNQPAQDQGLHDLTYYKGKLYAYFGPAPAVLLFIPYRLLHVGDLSPTLAGLIFCVVGFAFSVLLFQLLVRRFFGSIPIWMESAAVLALGLAIPAPFIIYVGRAYEVSIACAYAEIFVGLYFLARGLLAGREPKLLSMAVGSLFLAGAVAARPSSLAAGLFIVAAAVILFLRNRTRPLAHPVRTAFALLGPYVAVGILLALYNYVRFDSFAEFGTSYQLLGTNPRTYPFNQLWYIPHGIYYFLFSPPHFSGSFPYLFLRPNTFDVNTFRQAYQNEPVAGILTSMPVITVGLLMAVGCSVQFVRKRDPVALVIGLCALVPALMIVVTTYSIRGTTMRYELEYAPLLLMAGLIGWLSWTRITRDRAVLFWSSQVLWVAALVWSVLFNLAIAASPCAGRNIC